MPEDGDALRARERMRVAAFPDAADVSAAVAAVIISAIEDKAHAGELLHAKKKHVHGQMLS